MDSPTPEFPPIDVGTEIAPLNQKGQPDFYRHVPKRLVSHEEATARGFSMFYDGRACRFGHQSAAWTSNEHRCVDCERLKKGLPTIYPASRAQKFYTEPRTPRKDATAPVVIQAPAVAPKPPEPDAADRLFLTALAETRSFAQAAQSAGTTIAQIQSRISCNQIFKAAVNDLTERLQIAHPVAVAGDREWMQEEYTTFCRAYVDTGSLAKARAAIGVTPSQMHDELRRSDVFQTMFDEAAPKAALALDDIAIELSLAGNDKLLSKTLPAKLREEYGERVRVDFNNLADRLTPEQLNSRLAHAFRTLMDMGPHVLSEVLDQAKQLSIGEPIDAEFTDADGAESDKHGALQNVEPARAAKSDSVAGDQDSAPPGDGTDKRRDSNDDLL